MSNKINIALHSRPCLRSIFARGMENGDFTEKVIPVYGSEQDFYNYWDNYGYEDDYYDDTDYGYDSSWDAYEDGALLYPKWNKKRDKAGKRYKRGGKKKKGGCKVIDIHTPYSGDEENADEYEGMEDEDYENVKEIYFFPDYHNRYEYEEFSSLKELDEYCQHMGIHVSEESSNILYLYDVCYCCIDASKREEGELELVVESNYDYMFYEACTESELN